MIEILFYNLNIIYYNITINGGINHDLRMIYKHNDKKYKVESVAYDGMIINVNGTSITDCDLQAKMFGYSWRKPCGEFTVFCDGDELVFPSFEDAYDFAMNKQKDTFRI